MTNATRFAPVLTVLAVAALANSAAGTIVLIDFGRDDNTSPAPYNNVAFPSNGNNVTTGLVPLLDSVGGATGWTVSVSENGTGNGGNAGSSADVGVFPPALSGFASTAKEDSLYANGSLPGMVVSLNGLDDGLAYDLMLYGSRAAGQSVADQTWRITQGGGGGDVVHPSGLNTTTVVDWKGISTNGSGTIEFTITGTTSGALALNFASIVAVPEPTTILIWSLLAGLGVGLRWRRRK